MSINIPLLAKKVSEKEADVRVHVRTRVVQIQRRRLGIGSVVVTRTHNRQALNELSPPEIYFAVVLLVSFCEFIQPTSICPISHNLSETQKKYFKKTTLQDADVQLELLWLFNQLSYDMRFIDEKCYKLISERLCEIGQILVGWTS